MGRTQWNFYLHYYVIVINNNRLLHKFSFRRIYKNRKKLSAYYSIIIRLAQDKIDLGKCPYFHLFQEHIIMLLNWLHGFLLVFIKSSNLFRTISKQSYHPNPIKYSIFKI